MPLTGMGTRQGCLCDFSNILEKAQMYKSKVWVFILALLLTWYLTLSDSLWIMGMAGNQTQAHRVYHSFFLYLLQALLINQCFLPSLDMVSDSFPSQC